MSNILSHLRLNDLGQRMTLFFAVFVFLFSVHIVQASTISKPFNNLGLIGYWSFDDNVDTQAVDHSGYGNSGTLTNGPTWTTGKISEAVNFDGVDDYVSIPNSTVLKPAFPVTVSAWVNRGALGASGGVVFASDFVADKYAGYTLKVEQDGSISITLGDNSSNGGGNRRSKVTTSGIIQQSQWYFITGVINGLTDMAIYVNGSDQGGSYSGTGSSMTYSSQSSSVGDYGAWSDAKFTGKIDEVRVYNRSLSSTEVISLYNQTASAKRVTLSSLPSLGLIGYWSFDDGSGITAADYTGQGNTGTLTNGPTWTTGKFGSAVNFDGSNDVVTINNPVITGAGSICMWFRPTDAINTSLPDVQTLFGKNGNDNFSLHFYSASWGEAGRLHLVTEYDSNNHYYVLAGTNDTWNAGQWYNVCATYDSSGAKLYVNGSLDVSDTNNWATASGVTGTTNLVLAQWSSDEAIRHFKGSMDDIRVYSRALSVQEITALYNQTATLHKITLQKGQTDKLTNGLVGYWSFNGADISGTTALDRSGQGNDGTLTNGPTPTIGKVGQALLFDGSNDYVNVNSAVLGTIDSASTFTLSTWVKPNSTQASGADRRSAVATAVSTNDFEVSIGSPYVNSGTGEGRNRLSLEVGKAGVASQVALSSSDYVVGNWYYIVGVFTNGEASLYVNGLFESSITYDGTISSATANSNTWGIGSEIESGADHYHWNGSLDEVRIYNRALSVDEIKYLYNLGR